MKSALLGCLVGLGLATMTSRGAGPDDRYLEIYKVILAADELSESARPQEAVGRYNEAADALKKFSTDYPTWNPKAVKFRAAYIDGKLEAVQKRFPAATPPPAPAPGPGQPQVAQPTASADRIKALELEVTRLADENAVLQARIREALAVNPAGADPKELARAQAEIQRLENALRKAVVQPVPAAEPAKPSPAGEGAEPKKTDKDAAETKKLEDLLSGLKSEKEALTKANAALEREKSALERERSRLDEQLEASQKRVSELAAAPASGGRARRGKLDRELETLKAKLAVYEAKAVPLTSEELALFNDKVPAPVLTETNQPATAVKRPKANIPSGAGPLVKEAQRAYELGRHEEARAKFEQVLGQDENNPFLLTHLAAAEYALEQFSQAEGHVKKALEIDPDDAAGLYLMGMLRSREGNQDAALDALSRAAQIDPTNARTQNSIGLTLAKKGQRKAAETAFRRAVMLDPGYGAAHFNLAVEYATQKPASFQLARWHYQKAIATGHPRDPEVEKSLEAPSAAAAN